MAVVLAVTAIFLVKRSRPALYCFSGRGGNKEAAIFAINSFVKAQRIASVHLKVLFRQFIYSSFPTGTKTRAVKTRFIFRQ
jgi:hypothetical protein